MEQGYQQEGEEEDPNLLGNERQDQQQLLLNECPIPVGPTEEELQEDPASIDQICPPESVLLVNGVSMTTFERHFHDRLEQNRITNQRVHTLQEIYQVKEQESCPIVATTPNDSYNDAIVRERLLSQVILLPLDPVVAGSFSSRILEQDQVRYELEVSYRIIYNRLAQRLCDPLYRSVTSPQFISLVGNKGSDQFHMEFIVDYNCYGTLEHCNDDTTDLFFFSLATDLSMEATSNGSGRRKLLRNHNGRGGNSQAHTQSKFSTTQPQDEHNKLTHRSLQQQHRQDLQDLAQDGQPERCFCRANGASQPPSNNLFDDLYNDNIFSILEANKLVSCQPCENDLECQSTG